MVRFVKPYTLAGGGPGQWRNATRFGLFMAERRIAVSDIGLVVSKVFEKTEFGTLVFCFIITHDQAGWTSFLSDDSIEACDVIVCS